MLFLPKEFIVKSYKRMAEINDGKPVGENVFSSKSGIKGRYWRGGYWLSWAEFQMELGFTPTAKTSRYPDEFILRHLAELALEVKRLPTVFDLRVRRKAGGSFPSDNAFQRWKREERMRRLGVFCEGKPEFAPVLELVKREQFHQSLRRKGPPTTLRGVVYLTRRGEGFNIGRIRACKRQLLIDVCRLRQQPDLVHMIKTDDPEGIERYWRGRFRAKLRGRKSYRLSDNNLAVFKRRRFQ